jgi:uncharacterized repeat protein (TIGR01451 family)
MKLLVSFKALFQQKHGRQNAQGMMEFALVMPLLLLVVYGLFEVGRLVFIYSNVISAAREAVRYGSATGIINQQPQYKDCNGIRAAAKHVDFLDAIANTDIDIYYYDVTDATTPVFSIENATCPAASAIPSVPSGGRIRVSVTGTFSPFSAFVHLRNFTLISTGERTILGVMHVAGGNPPSGGGSGGGGSDGNAPTLRKSFSPLTIPVDGKSTIVFIINNPNATTDFTGLSFSDNYPSGLKNSTPLVTTNTCGGTLQASAGGDTISLSGGYLPAYGECTLTVVVTSSATGTYVNTSDPVSSVEGGIGNEASATLSVIPAFVCNGNKIVHGSIIRSDGAYDLFMVITNYSGQDLTVGTITTTWNSDDGNKKNKGIDLINVSLGPYSQAISSGNTGPEYSFTPSPAWILPPGNTTILLTFNKMYNNMDATEHITMTFTTAGCAAFTLDSAFVTPPNIEKAFSPDQISAGGNSTLTFTISNLNNKYISLNGVSFTDTFPSGMTRASIPASLQCLGTVTSTSGSITLSGGSIPPESTCTVSVNVYVANAGTYTNTSGSVGSTNGGTGNTATAVLVVGMLPPTLNYKSFNPSVIQVGGTSILTVKITNPNNTSALTGLAISDTFPSGMVLAATPAVTNTCGGSVTTTSGSFALADGTLAGAASCKVTVNVTSATPGTYTNTTGAVTSSNAGTGVTKSATLTVGAIQPPSISKSFSPSVMQVGGTSNLSISIYNPNSNTTLSGVAFTDTFADGNAASLSNTCGGSAVYSSGTITLTNGTLAPAASCTISMNVTPPAVGIYHNTSGTVTSINGGSGNTASATLTVKDIMPPVVSLTFSPSSIQVGLSSNLIFTISNQNTTLTLNGLAISDSYPSPLVNATPLAATTDCGGTLSAAAGDSTIALSGGSLAPGASCTVNVSVTTMTAKTYNNTSGTVTSSNGGNGNSASATLTVSAIVPPAFTNMWFSPNLALVDAPTTLSFIINNPNGMVTLSGIAFSDTFPAGMTRYSVPAASQCGGTVTSTSTSLALAGGTLGPGSSCTISVVVSVNTAGTISHSTGSVTSTNGGTGNTASASLTVTVAPCNGTTITHGPITYPSATTMQMQIDNATGKSLTINQVKVWWNYAYGHYTNGGHPRDPISISKVQLGSVILIGPSTYATSPLSIPGNANVLVSGSSLLVVTFNATYDNHEYDAFTMTFTPSECSGFTLSAP